MASTERIYTAESRVRNPLRVLRDMLEGVRLSPYMAYRICRKDIATEYARSAFGFLWDFVEPFVLATIFYFLRRAAVVDPGEITMPYAVFVIYGLLLYQTFAEAAMQSTELITRSKNLLTHVKLPAEALILSVFFRVGFNGLFRIAVLLCFSVYLHAGAAEEGLSAFSPLGFFNFVWCFPLLILSGMSIGVFLAPFHAIYADVGRAVRIVLMPLRYASPVLWAVPPFFEALDRLNPIAYMLNNLRLLATANLLQDFTGWVIVSAGSAVLFVVGWFIFHLAIPVLAERA